MRLRQHLSHRWTSPFTHSVRKARQGRGASSAVEILEARALLTPVVGVYDENASNPNTVDAVAPGSHFSATQFASEVAAAFEQNAGGVIDASVLGNFWEFGRGRGKTLEITAVEGTNWAIGTGFSISGTGSYSSTPDGGNNFTSLEFAAIRSGGAFGTLLNEHVVKFGVTVTSTGSDYGNVTVTGRLASGGTVAASRVVNGALQSGDTFYGLAAPTGDYFVGFRMQYDGNPAYVPLRFDDIGFITSVGEPPPSLLSSLFVSLSKESAKESAAPGTVTGMVTRSGDLSEALVVKLSSSDTTEATVPPTVTILAGQASATFAVNLVDDAVIDASQTVTITASVGDSIGGPLMLDNTFASGGVATVALQSQSANAALAVQADGKTIAGSEDPNTGSWRLTRLNADGTLDTTFGTSGVVVTRLASDFSYPRPNVIKIQQDGRILVGGQFGAGSGAYGTMILARYNPNGSLDTTFGNNGIANLLTQRNWIEDIAIRPDGRILLAIGLDGTPFFRVARLTALGVLDSTFGIGGVRDYTSISWSAKTIEPLSNGGFLLAGRDRVARFNAVGDIDTSFGINGIRIIDFGLPAASVDLTEMQVLTDGRIVVSGTISDPDTGSDFVAIRLTTAGALDASFGVGGIAQSHLSANEGVRSMVIQNDGKIILGGSIRYADNTNDLAILRLTADGTSDSTFDGDGWFTQSLITYAFESIYDLSILNGRLVAVAGFSDMMRVVRYDLPAFVETSSANLTVTDDDRPITLTLTFSRNPIGEADGASAAIGTVTRDGDFSQPLVVNLRSSDTTEATVPATVTIPAGQSFATFGINAVNDTLKDGVQNVTITAYLGSLPGGPLQLDGSFGTNGIAPAPLQLKVSPPRAAIAVQADRKIILAGEDPQTGSWRISRLNANGSLDTTFGTGGITTTQFSTSNVFPIPRCVVLQSDGKILVGGAIDSANAPALARYNADGSIDTTFGVNGIVDFGATQIGVEDIAINSDGSIMVALTVRSGTAWMTVARLTSDGRLDTSFGTGGILTSTVSAATRSIDLLSDGGFILAGSARIAKFLSNGTLDTSFGVNGFRQVNFGVSASAVGARVLADGKIIVGFYLGGTGGAGDNFGAARLNADGSLDTSLNGTGLVVTDVGGHLDFPSSMVVQPDGKLILAGFAADFLGRYDVALVRYNTNGQLDTTFDGDGKYTASLVPQMFERLMAIALDGDRLVALGGDNADYRVARYRLAPDPNVSAVLNVYDDETTSLVVDTLMDENDGNYAAGDLSLREALLIAPAGATITFASSLTGGTIVLSQGRLALTRNITIDGLGASQFGISGNNASGIFFVSAGISVTLRQLTLSHGFVNTLATASLGGAIDNRGTLIVESCVLTLNHSAHFGGAISNFGSLTVTQSTFTNNSAEWGGAIHNRGGTASINSSILSTNTATFGGAIDNDSSTAGEGMLNITDSTLAGNTASWGGAIENGSFATLVGVTISGNRANQSAGGINSSDTLTLINSTISGNSAVGDGGGLVLANVATLRNVTIFGNRAASTGGTSFSGGGIRKDGATVAMHNTLIAGNVRGIGAGIADDVRGSGSTITGFNNFIADGASTTVPGNGADGNIVGADWTTVIDPTLEDNGGPTKTHAILRGGSSHNRGRNAQALNPAGNPLTTDQRGEARFVGAVDIGAIELANSPPVTQDLIVTIDEDGFVRQFAIATDPDGDSLIFAKMTNPMHGFAGVRADGQVTYLPQSNYFGTDSFTYTVTDGTDTVTATVMVTINPVNDAPLTGPQGFETQEDVPLSNQLLAIEVENEPFSFMLETGPSHGSVTVNSDGTFTYTPDPDFSGLRLLDTSTGTDIYGSDDFTFRVTDVKGAFSIGRAIVRVTPVNDAPVATDDTLNVNEDDSLSITLTPLTRLVLHSEPGDWIGQGLDYEVLSSQANFDGRMNFDNGARVWITGSGISWDLNFAAPESDYLTPGEYLNAMRWPFQNASQPGLDVSGMGRGSNELTGLFVVSDIEYNADHSDITRFAARFEQHTDGEVPGLFGTIQYNTAIGVHGGVLTNDSDVDGDFLRTILVNGPAHGTLTLGADGGLVYTPFANYSGTDSFTYRVTDGVLTSDLASVLINVAAAPDAPAFDAMSYGFSIAENAVVGFAVGTVAATDLDNDAVRYSIGGGNASDAFAIDSITGVITVADASKLNFETNQSIVLTVRATEQAPGMLFDETTVTISLTDVPAPRVSLVRYGILDSMRWVDAEDLVGRTAPWKIDRIAITFDVDVDVKMNMLSVVGSIGGSYSFASFSYEIATRTAVWRLAVPVVQDQLAFVLDGDDASDGVAGVTHDGEYLSGGDVPMSLGVLPGDVDGDGTVNLVDALLQRGRNGTDDLWADTNGDGIVNLIDALLLRGRNGTML